MNSKYDIIIIGGGFAGTSIAYKLSNLSDDLDVLLIERDELGSKPVSAVTFTDVVEDLDIMDSVRQSYNQIEFISTLGAKESYTYDEEVFALVDYKKACKTMFEKSGYPILYETVASIKNGNILLQTGENIDAKIIVDASGYGYKFRKELGLDVPLNTHHFYFRKLNNCNIKNPKSLHFLSGKIGTSGGWFFPINENECEIGVGEQMNRLSKIERKNIVRIERENIDQLYKIAPYSEILKDSQVDTESMVYYPFDAVKHVVKDNIVFLGDNAGMVHPVYGMGLHYISKVCKLCSKYCALAIQNNDINILKKYQNIWNYMLKQDESLRRYGIECRGMSDKQLDDALRMHSNLNIDKMTILSAIRGHIDQVEGSYSSFRL